MVLSSEDPPRTALESLTKFTETVATFLPHKPSPLFQFLHCLVPAAAPATIATPIAALTGAAGLTGLRRHVLDQGVMRSQSLWVADRADVCA